MGLSSGVSNDVLTIKCVRAVFTDHAPPAPRVAAFRMLVVTGSRFEPLSMSKYPVIAARLAGGNENKRNKIKILTGYNWVIIGKKVYEP